MGNTKLRKRGSDMGKLTDQQSKFVLEYLLHGKGTEAARRAGYKSPSVQACKLLKVPKIKAIIGKLRREQSERFTIEADMVLRHLCSCVTRDGKDFVDDKGLIHDNLNELPDEVTRAVDSIKQKVRKWYREDGEEVTEVETEIKLVPKAAALRMAMEHKGLFAAFVQEHKVAFNLDALFQDHSQIASENTLEIGQLPQKAITKE